MKRWVRRTGLALAAVAAVTIFHSVTQLRLFAFGQPGSGFVPLVLGLSLAGLSLALVVGHRGTDAGDGPFVEKEAALRLAGALGLIALAGASFETLGAVPAVAILVAGWLRVLERKPLSQSAAFGGFMGFLAWLVFQVGLEVQLPRGFWAR